MVLAVLEAPATPELADLRRLQRGRVEALRDIERRVTSSRGRYDPLYMGICRLLERTCVNHIPMIMLDEAAELMGALSALSA